MLRNLTPHQVTLVRHGLEPLVLAPESPCPRLAEAEEAAGEAAGDGEADGDGVPLVRLVRGAVQDLPPAAPGVWLVVSAMVSEACPERTDLVSPARLLRDAQGRITGCSALALPARRRWARELAEAEHALDHVDPRFGLRCDCGFGLLEGSGMQPYVRAAYLRERAQVTLSGTSAPHWSPEQCAADAQRDLDEARRLDPSGRAGYVDPRDGGTAEAEYWGQA